MTPDNIQSLQQEQRLFQLDIGEHGARIEFLRTFGLVFGFGALALQPLHARLGFVQASIKRFKSGGK